MKIALWDVAHTFRSAWHAMTDTPFSVHDHCLDVAWRIKDKGYDRVVCCIDAKPYKRAELYSGYKANRPANEALMVEQFDRVQRELQSRGFPLFKSVGYEADDIIATFCARHDPEHEIDIWTNDKDLAQLVTTHTSLVSTKNGDRLRVDDVTEKFGVSPDRVGDLLALMGDASDGIPHVSGIGKATAIKLLKEHGSIEGVLSSALSGGLHGYKSNIVTGLKEDAEKGDEGVTLLAATLVELMTDAPVEFGSVFDAPPEPVDMEEGTMDDTKMESDYVESRQTEEEQGGEDEIRDSGKTAGALARQQETQVNPPGAIVDTAMESIELRPGVFMTNKTFELMKQMAKAFEASGNYARKFPNAAAIFTVMELGQELGVPPQVACQNFHMIQGKPTPSAHFLIAMAQRDPQCIYFECIEETPDSVTYATKKKGLDRELKFSYSLEDAKTDRQDWAKPGSKNQRAMLRKTAGSQAARLWYPGACSGLYSLEEMGFEAEEATA